MEAEIKHNLLGKNSPLVCHFRKTRRAFRGHRRSVADTNAGYDEEEESDEDESSRFPWLHAIVQLNSASSFLCDHQGACPTTCHRRQSRGCTRLTKALKMVYAGEVEKQEKVDKLRGGRGTGGGVSPVISPPQYGSLASEQKSKNDKPDEEMLTYINTKVRLRLSSP